MHTLNRPYSHAPYPPTWSAPHITQTTYRILTYNQGIPPNIVTLNTWDTTALTYPQLPLPPRHKQTIFSCGTEIIEGSSCADGDMNSQASARQSSLSNYEDLHIMAYLIDIVNAPLKQAKYAAAPTLHKIAYAPLAIPQLEQRYNTTTPFPHSRHTIVVKEPNSFVTYVTITNICHH